MKSPTPAPAKTTKPDAIDSELVRKLAQLLNETDLAELEVEKGDLRIRVARYSAAAPQIQHYAPPVPLQHAAPAVLAQTSPAAATPAPAAVNSENVLKSPMVGTAFRRPSPDSKAFVEIGSVVKAGDRVLLVEAMKTFNEILAHRSGTVTATNVEDGQPVEYGQALITIE